MLGVKDKGLKVTEVETILLALISDYFVMEVSLKKYTLLLKQDLRDKYKKYTKLKNKILNEPSITANIEGSLIKFEWLNLFKIFEIDITRKTENLSFHINLFITVKKIRELTNYSLLDICNLVSHCFEYFYLLPKKISKIDYAYSLRNKFYRLKEYKEEIIELLKIEYELYNSNMELTIDQLSSILELFNFERD